MTPAGWFRWGCGLVGVATLAGCSTPAPSRSASLDDVPAVKAAPPLVSVSGRLLTLRCGTGRAEGADPHVDPKPAAAERHPPRVGLPRPPGATFGSYHALVLGNDAYRHLPPLKTAVNDARAVAKILEHDYGFTVRLLLNATKDDLLTALAAMRGSLTERDNMLLYYAGRGALDLRNRRGYWLPIDAEPGNTAGWISTVAIADLVRAMSVRQLLVVADTCYGGTLAGGAVMVVQGHSEEERIKRILATSKRRSRVALTSGGVEPVLDGTGGRHSVFAEGFLDLLTGNVGILPAMDMHHYVSARVLRDTHRVTDYPAHVPEYGLIRFGGHEGGDFLFVRVK